MEFKAADVPEERVVDALIDLQLHDATDLRLGDELAVDENPPQQLLLILFWVARASRS